MKSTTQSAGSVGECLRSEMAPLTSLRFVAAMGVVFFHFGSTAARNANAPAPIAHLLANGYLGVTFFFVLSGFILTSVYAQRLVDVRTFALARFARLYPVYLMALILILPFAPPPSAASAFLAPALLHSWTMASSSLGQSWNAPGWTLSIEAFFYVAFPLILPAIQRLDGRTLVTALLAIATTMAMMQTPYLQPGNADLTAPLSIVPLPLLRLPEFLLGCCTAELARRLGDLRTSPRTDWLFAAIASSIIAMMASATCPAGIVAVCFAPLIALAAFSVGGRSGAFSRTGRWFCSAGRVIRSTSCRTLCTTHSSA